MTLLSRKVDYAILILSYLYRQAEGGCARQIAAHFDLSRGFVANILKLLCHKGFVASHRGVKGGYVLNMAAEEISLADLMDSLDDSFHLTACTKVGSDGCAVMNQCTVRGAIADVHQRLRNVLRSVSLADLCHPVATAAETQFGLEIHAPGSLTVHA